MHTESYAAAQPLPLAELPESAREEYWATLALRHCPGIGARTVAKLLKHFGSAVKACDSLAEWTSIGISERCIKNFKQDSWESAASAEWHSAGKSQASILLWQAQLYPYCLRQIIDPPALLYCSGDLSLLKSPGIAIVGSRAASQESLKIASVFAKALSKSGINVISGMAQGIDRAAHSGALAGPGSSIGVLGTGINLTYPYSNQDIYAEMRTAGLLLSEFAPDAPPVGSNFPIRNRIISGLALGIVVVEAAIKSGSLITARLGLEQNRSVFAVPGHPLDNRSSGCKNLIRQGAIPAFDVDDVLRDLADVLKTYGIAASQESVASSCNSKLRPPDLATAANSPAPERSPLISPEHSQAAQSLTSDDVSAKILESLAGAESLHIDQLLDLTGLSHGQLSAALIGLEMLGRIRMLPGSRYEVLA